MANIYWGALYFGATIPTSDNNWNTAANWFSNPGSSGGCCPCVPATPAGRAPSASLGDTVVFVGNFKTTGGHTSNINTGPTGGWAGAFSWLAGGSVVAVNDGNFTAAALSIRDPSQLNHAQIGGTITTTGTLTVGGAGYSGYITGGTHSGAVALESLGVISGGTFTDTVTRFPANAGAISGGTYKPAGTVTLTYPDLVNPAGIPIDPGFAEGGGTFAPVLTISGNVYPAVADVLSGTDYGPTGADYTGTYIAPSGGDILGAGLP